MREIKFRAWNSNAKMFILNPRWQSCYNSVGCELQQYTGRKDKKGVDIYESDIVRVPKHYIGDNLCPSYIAVITYSAPEFQTEPCFDGSWNDIEVIGNIYDNPELLEGVQ